MTLAHSILDKLKEHLALPWPQNVSGQERVLMVVYPPSEERRVRRLVETGEFAQEVRALNHGWSSLDLATTFSQWLAKHEYGDRLLQRPERLWDDKGNVNGLEGYLVERICQASANDDPNTVFAMLGCGGLFGLFSVSRLIQLVAERVPGRLVAFFPGEFDAAHNSYRLLGAKDGWGYLATPITA
ncbi:MAG: hypothetical protein QE272_11525 [Nevskia sp.]|nr:hypothetical protein [Nevskia sp.]